jgi:hypothetical protein
MSDGSGIYRLSLADKKGIAQLRSRFVNATLIRTRAISALIVGATGINVLRVMTAFEQRHIIAVREDTIARACDRIAEEMPGIVLTLITPANDVERDALNDRAAAVGALLVHVDPTLDDATFRELLESMVRAALERRAQRDAAELRLREESQDADDPVVLSEEELDDGW